MRRNAFGKGFLVGTALTILSIVGIVHVEIDASINTMLIAGDSRYAAHDEHKSWFGSDEVLSIAIPFPDALAADALALQQQVVWALEDVKGAVDVSALVTQEDVVGRGDSLNVVPLVPSDLTEWADDMQAHIAQLRDRVSANSIIRDWLVSAGQGAIAIQVRLDDSPAGEASRDSTMAEIDRELQRVLGDREYFLAGHPFMKSEIARSISRDLSRLLPVTFFVMSFLLFVATRSLYVALVASLSVLLSVLGMVGAMGWLGLGITALSNTAPTILVALSTAAFLHLAAAFQADQSKSHEEAATNALAGVSRPMWIAAITTAAGYSSLCLSSVPIVREFGLALATGVLGATLIGTTILPALLAHAPAAHHGQPFAVGYGLGGLLLFAARTVSRQPVMVLVVSIALGVLMAVSAIQVEVDSSGPQRFEEDSRFRRSSRFYRSQLSGDVVESVYLTGQKGDFLNPEVLRAVKRIQVAAEALPEVDKSISIADHIARTYWVFGGESGPRGIIPDSRAAVAQMILIRESSGDPGALYDYISPEFDRIRIVLAADVQSSSVSARLGRDLEAIAKRLLPKHVGDYSVVSTEMLLSQAADVIAIEQVRSASLALLLVLTLVGVAFRSIQAAGLMVLPNVLPLVANLGIMSMIGIALSDATSIISATAIGIAVDSTVHIVSASRRAERRLGSRRAAVIHAMLSTGRPVVVTSLIVSIGFSFLLLSEFGSVGDLGALTALTMMLCLIADLLVLPSLLLVFADASTHLDPYLFSTDGGIEVGVRSGERLDEWVFASPRIGFVDGAEFTDIHHVAALDSQGRIREVSRNEIE